MTSAAGHEHQIWTDDEALLRDVMAALKVPRAGEEDLALGYDALDWGAVGDDAGLAELAYDSYLDTDMLVRGQAPGGCRALAFHGEGLRVEIEVGPARIEGQLVPPQAALVSLMTRSGLVAQATTDEVGYFSIAGPPGGAIRLECLTGGHARVVTGWVIV